MFQQAEARRSYEGIKVRWRGRLSSLEDTRSHLPAKTLDDPTHQLYMTVDGSSVNLPVSIERLPRLKVAHAGTEMEVFATIGHVGDLHIRLTDATVRFLG